MNQIKRIVVCSGFLLFETALIWACGFDTTLRAYLDARFWQPFSKRVWHFERENVQRVSVPYAGMGSADGDAPLAKLRSAYQEISQPMTDPFNTSPYREAVAVARADQSLTEREREEVELIDAKIDMRAGQPHEPEFLLSAKDKLQRFLQTAKSPEFLSEARGWLAYIHFLLGEQTPAGQIYLDELNRTGSNLNREILLGSLERTYGYDGGPELLANLEQYFDTPEHAAFAIQLATNPHWHRTGEQGDDSIRNPAESYTQIIGLLNRNRSLLDSGLSSNGLTLLAMRTALRMGDPPAAIEIAAMAPGDAPVRSDPDFNWMLASARFLSRDYAGAEPHLLTLFRSSASSEKEKAAAAYGLCGIYQKTGNTVEQIRYALWLYTAARDFTSRPFYFPDQWVYLAVSGWDLNLLLDAEASIDTIRTFLDRYPDVPDGRLVRYSLAVRLSRENQYEEAAEIYSSINAIRRAPRIRRLSALYREANRSDLSADQTREAKYRLAEFLSANPDGVYFNDALWYGKQRYVLISSTDSRLTRQEREKLTEGERKLKDDQEERWRAYLILHDVVRDSGSTALGRRAARLAIRNLRQINTDRFGRDTEIYQADLELSSWLRR